MKIWINAQPAELPDGASVADAVARATDGQPPQAPFAVAVNLQFVPRGQELGWEPTGKWTKPSLVLISESNYSDAHLFPWTYHHLGIGNLVGMPVAGTGTAVWWETLQNPDLYFGIPEVGFRDAQGNYMEKALIQPDVQVANDPARIVRGEDQQLEAGVRELLKGLPKH